METKNIGGPEVGAQELNETVKAVRVATKVLSLIQGNLKRYRAGDISWEEYKRNAFTVKKFVEGICHDESRKNRN